jgi:hypothetical protein
MTRLTGTALTSMLMVLSIRVNGAKTSSMDAEKKRGLMERVTPASIATERKMELALFILLTVQFTQVNSFKMKLQAVESTFGLMERPMTVSGNQIRCTA